jgi:hypothetical protein
MPPVGFEITISAGERQQTYALDRAATEIGSYTIGTLKQHINYNINLWYVRLYQFLVINNTIEEKSRASKVPKLCIVSPAGFICPTVQSVLVQVLKINWAEWKVLLEAVDPILT